MPTAAPGIARVLVSLLLGVLTHGCTDPDPEPPRETTVYEGSVELGGPSEAAEFLLDHHEVTGDFVLEGEGAWDLTGLQAIGGSLLINDSEIRPRLPRSPGHRLDAPGAEQSESALSGLPG